MNTYGKSDKVCATCIYWRGKRDVDFIVIQTEKKEGKCSSEDGFYDIRTLEASCCSNWRGFPK